MIEYLDEEFNLHVLDGESECAPESWILIPDGAEELTKGINDLVFWSKGYKACFNYTRHKYWSNCNGVSAITFKDYCLYNSGYKVLWQRKDESIVNAEFFKEEKKIKMVDETLNERQSQYGCFEDVAFVTENIIAIMKKCNFDKMPNPHRMAMYMIASKMARLVNGDHNHKDSWHDIGGYAKLIENLIGGENE